MHLIWKTISQHFCVCMWACTYVVCILYAHMGCMYVSGGHEVSCSIIHCLNPLGQCLLVNVELGWQPISPSDPIFLSPDPSHWGYRLMCNYARLLTWGPSGPHACVARVLTYSLSYPISPKDIFKDVNSLNHSPDRFIFGLKNILWVF